MIQRLIAYGFTLTVLCGGCGRQTVSRDPVDTISSVPRINEESDSFFDSLRTFSFFTVSQFSTLYNEDSVRWYLVTDLLNYYFMLRWDEQSDNAEISFDDRIVERRLSNFPGYWEIPQGMSPEQKYNVLNKQCEKFSDFPTDGAEEENFKGGLRRFMERYLGLQYKRLLEETPKNGALARALQEEQVAWRNYVRAETAFFEQLNKISNPDRFSELGMKRGEFLDLRRKRREEADRITYFALVSSSYNPSFADYVTWAETQQEYSSLQARIFTNGSSALRTALAKESAAWFAFAKARSAVEDLLVPPGKQSYMTGTRLLKKYHLNDLKTW